MTADFRYAMQAWIDTKTCNSYVVGFGTIEEINKKWTEFKVLNHNTWKLKLYLQLDEWFNYPDSQSSTQKASEE